MALANAVDAPKRGSCHQTRQSCGRSHGGARAPACTWKLHWFRLELVQAPLVLFVLWGSAYTWDQTFSIPLKEQLGSVLDDLRNVKY